MKNKVFPILTLIDGAIRKQIKRKRHVQVACSVAALSSGRRGQDGTQPPHPLLRSGAQRGQRNRSACHAAVNPQTASRRRRRKQTAGARRPQESAVWRAAAIQPASICATLRHKHSREAPRLNEEHGGWRHIGRCKVEKKKKLGAR